MTRLILIITHLLTISGIAQNTDVILFTEKGEKFYLSINGGQVNDAPASRVEAFDVAGDFARINVRFEESGAPVLSKQMMLEPGMQMTAMLKRGKKGKYVFRPVSTHPKPPAAEQTVSIPATVEPSNARHADATAMADNRPESSGSLLNLKVNENGGVNLRVNIPSDEAGVTNDGSTDHQVSSGYSSGNITARVEGKKIILSDGRTLDWKYTKIKSLTGVEIEMEEPVGAQVAISYDGQVTHETDVPFFYREPDWKRFKDYFKLTVREANGATWSVKLQHSSNSRILIDNLTGGGANTNAQPVASTGNNDCSGMSDQAFRKVITSIENKAFTDEKMNIAGQILRVNCLYVSQVKTLMDLFTYEEDKIAIAKKSYTRTIDQNNYYQLNDALTYTASVEELNRFLESQY